MRWNCVTYGVSCVSFGVLIRCVGCGGAPAVGNWDHGSCVQLPVQLRRDLLCFVVFACVCLAQTERNRRLLCLPTAVPTLLQKMSGLRVSNYSQYTDVCSYVGSKSNQPKVMTAVF